MEGGCCTKRRSANVGYRKLEEEKRRKGKEVVMPTLALGST